MICLMRNVHVHRQTAARLTVTLVLTALSSSEMHHFTEFPQTSRVPDK